MQLIIFSLVWVGLSVIFISYGVDRCAAGAVGADLYNVAIGKGKDLVLAGCAVSTFSADFELFIRIFKVSFEQECGILVLVVLKVFHAAELLVEKGVFDFADFSPVIGDV